MCTVKYIACLNGILPQPTSHITISVVYQKNSKGRTAYKIDKLVIGNFHGFCQIKATYASKKRHHNITIHDIPKRILVHVIAFIYE